MAPGLVSAAQLLRAHSLRLHHPGAPPPSILGSGTRMLKPLDVASLFIGFSSQGPHPCPFPVPPPTLPRAPPLPACKSPDWAPYPSPTQIPHPALPALKALDDTGLLDGWRASLAANPSRVPATHSSHHSGTPLIETRTRMCTHAHGAHTCVCICGCACVHDHTCVCTRTHVHSHSIQLASCCTHLPPELPHCLSLPLQYPQGPMLGTWDSGLGTC